MKKYLYIVYSIPHRNLVENQTGTTSPFPKLQYRPNIVGPRCLAFWPAIYVTFLTQDWYQNTTENDLLYWGLDYPPLTAYHSWLVGKVASSVNSSWVELATSRGMESVEHKLMMRLSVLLADVIILFPAIFMFENTNYLTVITLLLYPGKNFK